MTLATLLALTLATQQIVEVVNHSEIAAPLRARAEASPSFISSVLLCPYCLSVWAGLACVLVWFVIPIAVWALAASRGANLINDLTHAKCRTPKLNHFDHEDDV